MSRDQLPLGAEPEQTYTLEEAVALAVKLHQANQLSQAETIYRSVLQLDPNQAVALHFLGVLEQQAGRFDAAVSLLERSVALCPDEAGWHQNLARTYASLHQNLQAEAAFRRSIALDPRQTQAYSGLKDLLRPQGRIVECVQLQDAWTVATAERHSPGVLGRAYSRLGQPEAAQAQFESWVAAEPDNPVARHMLLASRGGLAERASNAYVERTFDLGAERFNANLANLGYRAPNAILQAVEALPGLGKSGLDILDAGCGTGLCGPLILPFARQLVGVDLSSGMLAEADKLGVYHRLVHAELTAFLQSSHQQYDLVISADTLCYFGALAEVLGAAFSAIRPLGYLVFTVEVAPSDTPGGFRIEPSGRYQHTTDYLVQVAQASGFAVIRVEDDWLRTEGGQPVSSLLAVLQKP